MSDAVVEAVEASFKALVAERPYRGITVKAICEGASVSRRTFYANFIDKRAIMAYLFRRDAIEPVSRAAEILFEDEAIEIAPVMFVRFYQGIYDQREYYANLVKPMVEFDSTFQLMAAHAIRKLLNDIAMRFCPHVDGDMLRISTYYHASAQAITLEKWIYDDFDPPVERFAEIQAGILLPGFAALADLERAARAASAEQGGELMA